ncbi:hypothetical protein GCM10009609_36550 [Pseudonocardia aurantiaca]|uniref:UBP-type zinc finger domain-containing protein n=1 Tax=Pseudonocardia aurantiaca TaxID=75290 RepID=A0ABW4FT34_9PSEU
MPDHGPGDRRAGVELLAKRHYRAGAERLDEEARRHEFDIVAVGGHEHELPEFLDHLATTVWELVAGTFVVHPREDDLGRIRRSAEQVVHRYEGRKSSGGRRDAREERGRGSSGGRAERLCLWAGATAAVGRVLIRAADRALEHDPGLRKGAFGQRGRPSVPRSCSGTGGAVTAGYRVPSRVMDLDVASIRDVVPRTPHLCEECLRMGTSWVQLRLCLTCGHVGCCDSSPMRHARAHAGMVGRPIVQSMEPGETWRWCYVDEALRDGTPASGGAVRPQDIMSFEEARNRAYGLLGDVRDLLTAEFEPGRVATRLGAAAAAKALRHISAAKDALDRTGLG